MLVVVLDTIAKLNVLLDESECDLRRTEVTGLEQQTQLLWEGLESEPVDPRL